MRKLNRQTQEPGILLRLRANTDYLRTGLEALGYDLGGTQAPILPIVVGEELTLRKLSRDLCAAGIYASAIPYPAVARNQARIRFSVNANLLREDLDTVLHVMEDLGVKHGLLPTRDWAPVAD